MIIHFYVPDFPAYVQARAEDKEDQPVAVRDEGRVLAVNRKAQELGCQSGQLLESEQPEGLHLLELDIPAVKSAHRELRSQLEELSPIVENLELGEFFLERDDLEDVSNWFHNLEYEYPLTGAAAGTGWLARIVSRRQEVGAFEVVAEEDYERYVKNVQMDEIWGFGQEFVDTLKEKDFQKTGELFYLEETERRKLLGSDSRLLHQVFNGKDPRSINVFSRPRSLSRELAIPPETAQEKDAVIEKLDPVLNKFQERLEATVSLSHRLRLGLRFEDQRDLVRSHIFSTPVDDGEMFRFALRQMLASVALTVSLKTVVLEADIIVADLENYHLKPREAAMSFEIINK